MRVLSFFLVALVVVILSACGGGKSSEQSVTNKKIEGVKEVKINAASYTDWYYFNLATQTRVNLTEAQAKNSAGWHLAFRRNHIRTNGGDSGIGKVSLALADAQSEFYDSQKNPIKGMFINATKDAYLDDLKKSYDYGSLTFEADKNQPAIKDWYKYNSSTHQISANTDNFYLLQNSAGDGFVKMKLLAASDTELQFEYYLQTRDDTAFINTKHSLTARIASGKNVVCIDFDTHQTVDCSSPDWDLRYQVNMAQRYIYLWLNSNIYGKGDGKGLGLPITKWAEYSAVDNIMANHLHEDKSTSLIAADKDWWAYNLNGRHGLWPNYRTYIIKVGDTANVQYYHMQIINYYSLGASGSPEVRLYQP